MTRNDLHLCILDLVSDYMKCQQCEKPATFHITELTGPEVEELHLCEEHARSYLTLGDSIDSPAAQSFAGVLAQQLQLGQTAEDLARLDQQSCPICGITFYEFRNQGRLGCPHDYICFESELEPLVINIHGANEHMGKRPKRVQGASHKQTDLIRLRREMKDAVSNEEYERASELRDEIQRLEKELSVRGDD